MRPQCTSWRACQGARQHSGVCSVGLPQLVEGIMCECDCFGVAQTLETPSYIPYPNSVTTSVTEDARTQKSGFRAQGYQGLLGMQRKCAQVVKCGDVRVVRRSFRHGAKEAVPFQALLPSDHDPGPAGTGMDRHQRHSVWCSRTGQGASQPRSIAAQTRAERCEVAGRSEGFRAFLRCFVFMLIANLCFLALLNLRLRQWRPD